MTNNNITSIPFSLSDLATNLVILFVSFQYIIDSFTHCSTIFIRDLSYNSIDDLSNVMFGDLFYLRSLSYSMKSPFLFIQSVILSNTIPSLLFHLTFSTLSSNSHLFSFLFHILSSNPLFHPL